MILSRENFKNIYKHMIEGRELYHTFLLARRYMFLNVSFFLHGWQTIKDRYGSTHNPSLQYFHSDLHCFTHLNTSVLSFKLIFGNIWSTMSSNRNRIILLSDLKHNMVWPLIMFPHIFYITYFSHKIHASCAILYLDALT